MNRFDRVIHRPQDRSELSKRHPRRAVRVEQRNPPIPPFAELLTLRPQLAILFLQGLIEPEPRNARELKGR
jgi:hypothetical protein